MKIDKLDIVAILWSYVGVLILTFFLFQELYLENIYEKYFHWIVVTGFIILLIAYSYLIGRTLKLWKKRK